MENIIIDDIDLVKKYTFGTLEGKILMEVLSFDINSAKKYFAENCGLLEYFEYRLSGMVFEN